MFPKSKLCKIFYIANLDPFMLNLHKFIKKLYKESSQSNNNNNNSLWALKTLKFKGNFALEQNIYI